MSDSNQLLVFPEFFQGYINLSGNQDIITLLQNSITDLERDLKTLNKQTSIMRMMMENGALVCCCNIA
jgi:hypothetical protein